MWIQEADCRGMDWSNHLLQEDGWWSARGGRAEAPAWEWESGPWITTKWGWGIRCCWNSLPPSPPCWIWGSRHRMRKRSGWRGDTETSHSCTFQTLSAHWGFGHQTSKIQVRQWISRCLPPQGAGAHLHAEAVKCGYGCMWFLETFHCWWVSGSWRVWGQEWRWTAMRSTSAWWVTTKRIERPDGSCQVDLLDTWPQLLLSQHRRWTFSWWKLKTWPDWFPRLPLKRWRRTAKRRIKTNLSCFAWELIGSSCMKWWQWEKMRSWPSWRFSAQDVLQNWRQDSVLNPWAPLTCLMAGIGGNQFISAGKGKFCSPPRRICWWWHLHVVHWADFKLCILWSPPRPRSCHTRTRNGKSDGAVVSQVGQSTAGAWQALSFWVFEWKQGLESGRDVGICGDLETPTGSGSSWNYLWQWRRCWSRWYVMDAINIRRLNVRQMQQVRICAMRWVESSTTIRCGRRSSCRSSLSKTLVPIQIKAVRPDGALQHDGRRKTEPWSRIWGS